MLRIFTSPSVSPPAFRVEGISNSITQMQPPLTPDDTENIARYDHDGQTKEKI